MLAGGQAGQLGGALPGRLGREVGFQVEGMLLACTQVREDFLVFQESEVGKALL